MSASVAAAAVGLVLERLAIAAARLGQSGSTTLATQARIMARTIDGFAGGAEGAAEGLPPYIVMFAAGAGLIAGTAASLVLAPALAALGASVFAGAVTVSTLELIIGAVASYAIGVGVTEGIEDISSGAPDIQQALQSIVQGAGTALSGVASVSYIPSSVSIWGTGALSDVIYYQLGTDLSLTNTTLTVAGNSSATAQAFGATPSGPSFTLSFNADGTVNEAVQSVTLDQNIPSLNGNNNITIAGVLSVNPGISGSVAGTSVTNEGIINIGDPTSLTISGPLENDGMIQIAAGSTLTVQGAVTEDPDQVGPIYQDFGADLNTITATGVVALGNATDAPISWTGTETRPGSVADYERMETQTGPITNPYLVGLGAQTAVGLSIIPPVPAHLGLGGVPETISYSFSVPLPSGTPFFLWDPGANDYGSSGPYNPYFPSIVPYTGQTYHGPYTFTFAASLDGVPVSTSGWTFSVVNPLADQTPTATYAVSSENGSVTVTNYGVTGRGPTNAMDAIVVAIPNTPIDAIAVTGTTTVDDEWGLALPSPGGQISIGDNATAIFDSTVDIGQTVVFGQDSNLVLPGNISFGAVISGFAGGDVIHYMNLNLTLGSIVVNDGFQQVGLLESGIPSISLNFEPDIDLSDLTAAPDGSGGTFITLGTNVCFLAGTQIATPEGEMAIEHLTIGDKVLTYCNGARSVKWIGEGRVLAIRGHRTAATPVIVRKGALADNIPHRDLRVTKGHSLFIDDVLIPVEFLVNHRSILWDDRAQEVTIYHIELETHDVLIANDAPAESYRDDGNRWLFQNANTGWNLPPKEPCAPVLTGGFVVDSVWRRILDRTGPRKGLPLTDEADLHVLIDGQRLDAANQAGDVYVFHLPAVPADLRIASRAAVPAELGLARDFRALGVALLRVVVRKGTRFRTIKADDARLSDGFHAFEPDNGFRWTDGDAAVPAELFEGFSGPLEFVLHVGATTRYLDEGQAVLVA